MVTAYVAGDKVHVQDRFALFAPTLDTGYEYSGLTASLDAHNDWSIVSGSEDDGVTDVHLTRALKTGDSQDREIIPGPQRVVWAWGSADAVGYHGSRRGAGLVTFLNSANGSVAARPFPKFDGVWEGRFQAYVMPAQVTTYACQSMTLDFALGRAPTNGSSATSSTVTSVGDLPPDKHVVAIRPLEAKRYHHHAILHVCTNNSYWRAHLKPRTCDGASPLGAFNSDCSSLMWSWAVGGGAFVLPDSAGFLVGPGPDAVSHVILEVHYDNPSRQAGVVDNFGFEMFYVDTPRPNNAAGLTIGDPTIRMQVRHSNLPDWLPGFVRWPFDSGGLPPGHDLVHRQATCPGSCTSSALAEPIHVFASNLHMHYTGQKMYTEHFDPDGHDLGIHPAQRVDFFDNGFQQMTELADDEFVIRPGDELQTHCWYNTKARSREVPFGFSTKDEMCMNFVFYWPAQYKGTDTRGNPLRFANCGLFVVDSNVPPFTICGGLSQAGGSDDSIGGVINVGSLPFDTNGLPSFWQLGGQRGRGAENYADPVGFGAVNKPEGGMAGVASRCYPGGAPMPPPPAAPPPPPEPAGPASSTELPAGLPAARLPVADPPEAQVRMGAWAIGVAGVACQLAFFVLIGWYFVLKPARRAVAVAASKEPKVAPLAKRVVQQEDVVEEVSVVPPTPSQTASVLQSATLARGSGNV